LEFESGRRATAIKNVTLAEEHLHDHFPGAPLMPNSLVIEGLAQCGGLLVGEHGGFEQPVVLAKVSRAAFHFQTVPGDTLIYRSIIQTINKDGAMVTGTSHVGERLQGEVDLFFAQLDENFAGKSLFDPTTFLALLKMLGMFSVGHGPDGGPLQVPISLLPTERECEIS
jgi:3-hydroxyacyl-[acyl-carrier-protein] dehydratase